MSVVYLIHDGEHTKIGITTGDVKVRMSALQSPRDLVCLGTIPGGRELESRLHRLFAARRVRGEWFEGEIGIQDVEKALQEDEERKCRAAERASERAAESRTLANRCRYLGEWLSTRTNDTSYHLFGDEDWDSPFLQLRYAPVLWFIDMCSESGIDLHSVQAVVRLQGAFSL